MSAPLDDNEMVTVSGLSSQRVDFELGGRAGNIVTNSSNTKIGKGWRLLCVNGEPLASTLTAAEVKATVDVARRKGKFTATFFGGKLSGGGGMNMEALGKATLVAQKLAAQRAAEKPPPAAKPAAPPPSTPKASAPSPAPPPPPPPPPPLSPQSVLSNFTVFMSKRTDDWKNQYGRDRLTRLSPSSTVMVYRLGSDVSTG